MLFRLFASVLLTALFLQSAAVFGPLSVTPRTGDLEHLMVHGQEADHHHHSDSSLHMGDEGAVQHSHPDYNGNSAALISAHMPALLAPGASSRVESGHTLWMSATVDGLLRPPMPRG